MIGIYIALVSVIFLVAPYCVSPYLSYKNRLVEPLLVGSFVNAVREKVSIVRGAANNRAMAGRHFTMTQSQSASTFGLTTWAVNTESATTAKNG